MNATIKICGLKDLRAIDAAISNGHSIWVLFVIILKAQEVVAL